MDSQDERAYGSYTEFCRRVGVTPMPFPEWNTMEEQMEQQKPVQPRRRPALDNQKSAPYLDLVFPSLHANEAGKSYVVVGPR